jgi:hypothetical protein
VKPSQGIKRFTAITAEKKMSADVLCRVLVEFSGFQINEERAVGAGFVGNRLGGPSFTHTRVELSYK